ncbi:MAG: hypothetical protein AABX51_08910, partial [Nanoarchaeota archaeon]
SCLIPQLPGSGNTKENNKEESSDTGQQNPLHFSGQATDSVRCFNINRFSTKVGVVWFNCHPHKSGNMSQQESDLWVLLCGGWLAVLLILYLRKLKFCALYAARGDVADGLSRFAGLTGMPQLGEERSSLKPIGAFLLQEKGVKNYLLKKAKRIAVSTPTTEANCPIQNMNIHLISSAFISRISTRMSEISFFVATVLNSSELLVSKAVSTAVSTAEAMVFACGSSNFKRSISKIFNDAAYAIKSSFGCSIIKIKNFVKGNNGRD